MKTCYSCKEEKGLVEFNNRTGSKDGKQSQCKACTGIRLKEYRQGAGKDRNREYKLMTKYGLTQEQYNNLLITQGGGCAICGMTPERNGKALAVDHDHSCCPGTKTCGKCVRGLLCSGHNAMLGLANDNTETLRLAIDYINHHK